MVNMAGYMPESEPTTHDTWKEAKDDLCWQLGQFCEDEQDENSPRFKAFDELYQQLMDYAEPDTVVGGYANGWYFGIVKA